MPDKTNNTNKFIRDTQTLNTTGLKTPIDVTAQFVAPDIGPNYKYSGGNKGISNIILYYTNATDGKIYECNFIKNGNEYTRNGKMPQEKKLADTIQISAAPYNKM